VIGCFGDFESEINEQKEIRRSLEPVDVKTKKLERVPDLIRHASPESLRAKKITKANNVGTGIDFFPSRAEET